MYIYHNFFFCSCVDGHLGCFHVLAIVYDAIMNMGIQVSWHSVSVSIVAEPVYIPTSSVQGFPFLHILLSIYLLNLMLVILRCEVFWRSLYILVINPLSDNMVWKYFLPFHRLSFNFIDGFLCCTAAFLV